VIWPALTLRSFVGPRPGSTKCCNHNDIGWENTRSLVMDGVVGGSPGHVASEVLAFSGFQGDSETEF
jgi:hypothetical protein